MARPTNKQIRKREARELLENKTLKAIFDEQETKIKDAWTCCEDRDDREKLHMELYALNELKEYIYACANR